jgi:hypothetical protein
VRRVASSGRDPEIVAVPVARWVTRRGGPAGRRAGLGSPYGGEVPGAPDDPIAYAALEQGTPVLTKDGSQFATVQRVLVDEKVSVFDGIVFSAAMRTRTGTRFVDAGQVDSIYTSHVRTTLSAEQAAGLPAPSGSSLVEITPARSMGDRLGRLFGRRKQ